MHSNLFKRRHTYATSGAAAKSHETVSMAFGDVFRAEMFGIESPRIRVQLGTMMRGYHRYDARRSLRQHVIARI